MRVCNTVRGPHQCVWLCEIKTLFAVQLRQGINAALLVTLMPLGWLPGAASLSAFAPVRAPAETSLQSPASSGSVSHSFAGLGGEIATGLSAIGPRTHWALGPASAQVPGSSGFALQGVSYRMLIQSAHS